MRSGLPSHQQDALKQLNLLPQRTFAGLTLPLSMTLAMLQTRCLSFPFRTVGTATFSIGSLQRLAGWGFFPVFIAGFSASNSSAFPHKKGQVRQYHKLAKSLKSVT